MVCGVCGGDKPLDAFPRDKRRPHGRRAYCKDCIKIRSRAIVQRSGRDTRHYHLKQKYGIGLTELETMIAAQDGLCALCGEEPAVQVDHDHKTGKVRGILCDGCNGGLGLFRDDIETIENAIRYLDRHRG